MNKKEILKMLNQARIFHNYLEDEEKAIRICCKILKEHPENRDAMLIKAGSLSCINKEKEAYQLISKIIEKWPKHWEAYYLMGLLLFNTNEEMAMEKLINSIELEEKFDNNITAAQLAYFMQNADYKEYLKKAEKIEPERFERYMKEYWEWDVC